MALIETKMAGIALTAQTFNPSIFTETWLAQNSIIPPDQLVGMRIFSPEVAQFQTSDMQILVMPPKMQITFRVQESKAVFDLPQRIATRTVQLLPHTPYQGLGLNFDYFIAPPPHMEFNAYDRTLFGAGDSQLLREFSTSDAKFGTYLSKNYGAARLKLDIKPVSQTTDNKELIHFSFNFHHDVAGIETSQRVNTLVQLIGKMVELQEYAQRLVVLGCTLQE